MAEKRLYWLKLREGFFSERAMKKLRRMAGGDTYTIIYLKLLLLGLRAGGKIYYEGVEDTFHEEIALELDEKPDDVQFCLLYLQKVGLIEIVSENELFLTETPELTYSESQSTVRSRRCRERKALQCNADATQVQRDCNKNATPDIDNKIEDNKTTDIENNSTNSTIPRSCKTTSEAEDKEEAAVYEFPCVKGKTYAVTQSQIDSWMEDYPNVDVHQALRNARAWIRANPKRIKTLGGYPRFINRWLGNDQDSGKNPRKGNNNSAQSCSAACEPSARARTVVDYQAIVDDYNTTCTKLPACKKLSETRKRAIKARLNTYSAEELHKVFVAAQNSSWHTGENDRNWRADFDWLMTDRNAAKMLERYERDGGGTKLDDWEKDWLAEYRAMTKEQEQEEQKAAAMQDDF